MTKEIFLSGMTADQLSEMIRESLRDELRQLHPEPSAKTPNYLTRRETARRLGDHEARKTEHGDL